MNPPDIDYSEPVVLLKADGDKAMSLAGAVRTVMLLTSLGDRLACTIMRKGAAMHYAEIVRIAGRNDFPRQSSGEGKP